MCGSPAFVTSENLILEPPEEQCRSLLEQGFLLQSREYPTMNPSTMLSFADLQFNGNKSFLWPIGF